MSFDQAVIAPSRFTEVSVELYSLALVAWLSLVKSAVRVLVDVSSWFLAFVVLPGTAMPESWPEKLRNAAAARESA